jgi:hypothetical protein
MKKGITPKIFLKTVNYYNDKIISIDSAFNLVNLKLKNKLLFEQVNEAEKKKILSLDDAVKLSYTN